MTGEDRAHDREEYTGYDKVDKVYTKECCSLFYMILTEGRFLLGEHRDQKQYAEIREPCYTLVPAYIIIRRELIVRLLPVLLILLLVLLLTILLLSVSLRLFITLRLTVTPGLTITLRLTVALLLIVALRLTVALLLIVALRLCIINRLLGLKILRGLLSRYRSTAIRTKSRAVDQLLTALLTKCHNTTSFHI